MHDTLTTDTTLFVVALLILGGLLAFVLYDYYLRYNNRPTFSAWCHAFTERRKCQPIVWVGIGAVTGFVVGLVSGFILGHLFWS